MPDKTTIAVIDDHALFREGVRAIIEKNAAFQVIGEAGSAREGLSLVQNLKPDLVLVDISLPDKSGIQLVGEIGALHLPIRVLVLSMHSKIEYVTEAFRAGAYGYMVKDSASDRLLEGLAAVTRGEYFLDRSISHTVVEKIIGANGKTGEVTDAVYSSLTPREQEVLRLLAEGLYTKEIATKLHISAKTVENHRANMMAKLGLHSSMELVRYAARIGVINVELWKG